MTGRTLHGSAGRAAWGLGKAASNALELERVWGMDLQGREVVWEEP